MATGVLRNHGIGLTVGVALLLGALRGQVVALEPTQLTGQLTVLGQEQKLEANGLSFLVVGPDGTELASYRKSEAAAPASNLKLLTAIGVLDQLGPAFEISTELYRTGAIDSGALAGDLVVRGHGDPSLSGRFHRNDVFGPVRPWVAVLKELGVTRVLGRVLCDDRYFSGPSTHPDWPRDQMARWYCAPSGAINLNDNCVDVHLEPRVGAREIRVWLVPPSPRFEVVSQLRSVTQRQQHVYSVERPAQSWRIEVRGGFLESGSERTEWVTVPDPTEWFGSAFVTFLESEGIEVVGGWSRVSDDADLSDALPVASNVVCVASLLPPLLKRSLNLYADCLLRIVGKERGGAGSFEVGAASVRAHLIRVGIGDEGLVVRDGSGLSAGNRASAQTLVTALRYAQSRPWFTLFRDSLAIAGVDGTLRTRFGDGPLNRQVFAKTGHIQGVSTLAGYLKTDLGDVAFAFLYQGSAAKTGAARDWQEACVEEVSRALERPR